MIDPIQTALSGLNTSRLRSATTANNLANLQTPGYKAQRANSATGPTGDSVQISSVGRSLSQGSLRMTGNPMDVAITGNGFFQVQDGEGNTFYTRAGSFQLDANGNLVTAQGFTVDPGIIAPAGSKVSIGADGTVTAQTGNGPSVAVGQIQLASFNNPEGLVLTGDGMAAATTASGPATLGAPGTVGYGGLVSGFLESSNVDLVTEMVNQIVETHTYTANVSVIRAADEMNRETLNLLA